MPATTNRLTGRQTARKTTFTLANRFGWRMVFEPQTDGSVLVRRSYRGADVGERMMERQAARCYWRSLRSGGFERVEGGW